MSFVVATSDDTLRLSVVVQCHSRPRIPVRVCTSCQNRESVAIGRKSSEAGTATASTGNGKRRLEEGSRNVESIVLFVGRALRAFDGGRVCLKARVTCYCRHHREDVGFRYARFVTFGISVTLSNMLPALPTQWPIHKGGLSDAGLPLQFSLLTATKPLETQLGRNVTSRKAKTTGKGHKHPPWRRMDTATQWGHRRHAMTRRVLLCMPPLPYQYRPPRTFL
jgi:hypothetical protein